MSRKATKKDAAQEREADRKLAAKAVIYSVQRPEHLAQAIYHYGQFYEKSHEKIAETLKLPYVDRLYRLMLCMWPTWEQWDLEVGRVASETGADWTALDIMLRDLYPMSPGAKIVSRRTEDKDPMLRSVQRLHDYEGAGAGLNGARMYTYVAATVGAGASYVMSHYHDLLADRARLGRLLSENEETIERAIAVLNDEAPKPAPPTVNAQEIVCSCETTGPEGCPRHFIERS